MKGPVGLGIHRSKAHGIKGAARPPAAPSPAAALAAVPTADEDELQLRCSECDFHVDPVGHFARFRSHVMTVHGGRFPTTAEQKPRTAAQAEQSA